MSNEISNYMYELLSKLSSKERREIVDYLQDMELSAATIKDTGDIVN